MSESLYVPIIDNGSQLSRTSWALSMFMLGMSPVMAGRKVIVEGISYPYPDGAMNIASASFMESGCDRMLIIDADERFTPKDVESLLSHDLPLVAGLYPKKKPGLEFPVVPLDSDPNPFAEDGRGVLREVARTARGFMALRREVFEAMKPHVEKYVCAESNKEEFLYWKTLPGGHSEDFAFCDLWRKIGGKVWIDTSVRVIHEGSISFPIPGTY
jgi:hypothetical protein